MVAQQQLLIDRNLPLEKLLKAASHEDLQILADIITDEGKGRLSLSDAVKQKILKNKKNNTLHSIVGDLAREICSFGSNTVLSFVGKRNTEYSVVVRDVAKKLGAKTPKGASIIDLEELIIREVLKKVLAKSSSDVVSFLESEGFKLDKERLKEIQKKGDMTAMVSFLFTFVGPYGLSRLVIMGIASGMAIGVGAGGAVMGAAVVARAPTLLNPVGVVLSAAWIAYGVSGPAYRVTVPAVVCVAAIRQAWVKSMTDWFHMELKKCL